MDTSPPDIAYIAYDFEPLPPNSCDGSCKQELGHWCKACRKEQKCK